MEELAIKIEHVTKQYRLGTIGGGTLRGDLQSFIARKRGLEDPNSKIGSKQPAKVGERFLALDDISFEVRKGEAVGIIGHNGAGKSTLLKLLSRVTAPTSGKISFNGRIASMLEVGTGFHPELTGRENVYMNGAILGMTRAEIDRKFDKIVEFAEMKKFIDTPVKRYSSGMYVKLAFSVAAHLDSEIMVMDEVLAVGDMKFQQKCLGRMGDAANGEGRTVLYVSRNMNTIRQLCKRCIVMDHGKIIFDGNTEDAIAVYMENDSKMALTIDCSGERSYKDIDGKIRFENITFVNRADSPIYSQGERVQLKVGYKANTELHNFAFRVVIQTPDKVRVGMAMSGQILHTNPGTHSFHVEFPIDWLAPGKYNIVLVVTSINEFGTEQVHDRTECVCTFEKVIDVSTNNQMAWVRSSWGNIMIPDLKVSNV